MNTIVTTTPHNDPDDVVTTVHGNLFAHLGFDPAEQHLRLTQPRVSDLMRGKTEKFSLDMLITLAARCGRRVEVAVYA